MSPVLYDSHIHLTDTEYDNYLPSILITLKRMRIKACSVTVNISYSLKAIKLFKEKNVQSYVYNFVGIHPQFADENISKFEEIVISNMHIIKGIGEIGLDPTYYNLEKNTKMSQVQVFNKMLSIAETYDKPVSIHSRNSLDEILTLLSTYNLKRVCLHWFDGTPQQLEKALDMGLYISYGPSLVYSKKKQGLLRLTNEKKLLIETDGPVRYASCFRNVITLPSSALMSVVRSISEVLCLSPSNVIIALEKNSILFFD
ncbi:MAG TPA: TatD family hydrolase [Nitrososphaeraceae archaeon]|nr:TatD family hydrolase [Nitrososphaeraceae archaeon]